MAHKVKNIRIKDLYAITLLIVMIVQVVVVNAVFVCVGLGLLGLSDEALTIFAGCSMPHLWSCLLRYPIRFPGKKMKSLLCGEGFFIVD
ncbi:hypothetical protein MXX19_16605 [Klebsiella pneumoniae]|uniref:hypothetical protein n=1 Tax=Klebsiella pneumoniae TaxID=573 RepID=UPI002406DA86|nr:hypothetical protein [Klebsiella pneumoniae]MDG0782192.1 hypothetical protein [Klebsiella pneumoniae]